MAKITSFFSSVYQLTEVLSSNFRPIYPFLFNSDFLAKLAYKPAKNKYIVKQNFYWLKNREEMHSFGIFTLKYLQKKKKKTTKVD